MKLVVKNKLGKSSGSITADDTVWGVSINEGLVHQVVTSQLTNLRQGNHETKRRRDAEYSTAKIRPQKGSGRARMGSRSSMLIGGSVAHGPHKKQYRDRIPIQIRRTALKMALTDKVKAGEVFIIDEFKTGSPSAKYVSELISSLGLSGKVLIVVDSIDDNLIKSVRNIPNASIMPAFVLNALEAVRNKNVLITKKAVKKIDEIWGSKTVKDRQAKKTVKGNG